MEPEQKGGEKYLQKNNTKFIFWIKKHDNEKKTLNLNLV